jgi:hypothetical protein
MLKVEMKLFSFIEPESGSHVYSLIKHPVSREKAPYGTTVE